MPTTTSSFPSDHTTGDPSPVSVADVLKKARSLIKAPREWSGRGWGKNNRRCAIHAIYAANGGNYHSGAQTLLQKLIGEEFLGRFNDRSKHKDVIALFDRGIAIAKAEGARVTAPTPAATSAED